jgi:hypothetical protein
MRAFKVVVLVALVAMAAPVLADTTVITDSGKTMVVKDPPAGVVVAPQLAGSLTTIFASDNSFAGNMFDLQASVPLTITGFDVNLDAGADLTIEVYYRIGTSVGAESSAAGWVLMGSATVTSQGADNPTHVNVGGLALNPGTVYGIFVYQASYDTNNVSMLYTNGGPTTYSDSYLSLTTNCAKGTPAFTGTTFFPRIWNGTVYYAAQVDPIPVAGLWGLLALAALLAGAGWLLIRR